MEKWRNIFAFLHAFGKTRWGYRFRSREELVKHQRRQLEKFLKDVLSKATFYEEFSGKDISALPIVGKSDMLAAFDHFNTLGIDLKTAQALALRAEIERDFKANLFKNISVGLSSGTSGKRSVFLTSEFERHVWAGIILGRMLSQRSFRHLCNPFKPALRVALFLRANNNLYSSVNGSRIIFKYFDLLESLDKHLKVVESFSPDILIAPASVLHQIAKAAAEKTIELRPIQIISVAEVLEQDDIDVISAAWDTPVQQLYQCTEGFLGYTCPAGSLHLNEEFLHFEPVWCNEQHDYFEANVTDFTRQTQIFARFKMDDVLHVNRSPCECGSHNTRLKGIEGRCDDVLWLPEESSERIQAIFPDQLRRAMMLAHDYFDDYRIEQNNMAISLFIRHDSDPMIAKDAIEKELTKLWSNIRVVPPTLLFQKLETAPLGNKRRRIRCLSRPTINNASSFIDSKA